MRLVHYIPITLLAFTAIYSCVPKTDTVYSDVQVDLSDPNVQVIYNLQDRQKMDSLCIYLKHENPAYRYLAALAFGSIRKADKLDSLTQLLNDPMMEVRTAAAYSIGQIGDSRAVLKLIGAFKSQDTITVNTPFNAAILEAIGKTGSLEHLKSIAEVKTYRNTDTFLLTGQMKAVYRFMTRNITSPVGTLLALRQLSETASPHEVKLYAANYLSRGKELGLINYKAQLVEVFNKNNDPDIKMCLVVALGKTRDPAVLPLLKANLLLEKDNKILIASMKAMGYFPYMEVKDDILPFIKSTNINIAAAAGQFVYDHAIREDFDNLLTLVNDSIHWKCKTLIYGGLLKNAPVYNTRFKAMITGEVKKQLEASKTTYEKAAWIDVISQDPFNYELLESIGDTKERVIRVAVIQGYKNILMSPGFFKAFGFGYPKIKSYILEKLFEAVETGDAGMIYVVCEILKEPTQAWKEWIKDTSPLKDQLSKLKIPRDYEAYLTLKQTIDFLEGREVRPEIPEFNHPISWEILSGLTDTSYVVVKTTAGNFKIKFWTRMAPGTVANFVDLVSKKYYTGKIFHRVVPNFVIQGGCPRGDGFGSLDYSIRSELPQVTYNRHGLVGMASAGNHTEGVQWFVTLAPAPHLDGNYTIFGEITDGLDVVGNIGIGDKIKDVILVN